MTVHYQLTVEDFREGLLLYRRKSKVFLLVFGWIVFLFCLTVLLPVMAAFNGRDVSITLKNLLPLGLFVGIVGIFLWVSPRRSARQQFSSSPSSKGSIDLDVSETSLHFRSPTMDSKLSWQNFARLVEGKSVFLLFTSKQAFLVVPKRAFTAEQLDQFRRCIPEAIRR